jgi:hypothetical protein
MLLKILRGTGPGVVMLIFLVSSGIWLNAFLDPHIPASFHYDINPMPLYSLLKGLAVKSALGSTIASFVMVILMTFLLVSFNTTIFFINERTFLPSIIYILFIGLFPYNQIFNPVIPSAIIFMIAIKRIMDAYRKNGTAYDFFDASMLISIASLLYANLIWFGLLSIIGIALLRTGNLKEILLAILGLCTPPAITAAIYYVIGKDLMALASTVVFNLFGEAGSYYFSRVTIMGLIIIGLICLVSIFYLLSVMNGKKIKSRKTFSLLIYVFLISVIVFFAVPSVSVELIYIAAIPLSFFLTHYFVMVKRRLMPEILFTAFVLIVAVIQILYFIKR